MISAVTPAVGSAGSEILLLVYRAARFDGQSPPAIERRSGLARCPKGACVLAHPWRFCLCADLPGFYFSCFYAQWVLVFGDTRESTWPLIAVLLASGLGGAAAYFYARLTRRLGLSAWPLMVIGAWLLSTIIYAAAVVLDGWLG